MLRRLRLLVPILAIAATPPPADRLPSGPALVVVEPARPSAADLASEALGDHRDALASFVALHPELPVVRMTSARWRRVARRPSVDGYASAFVREDGTFITYDGMVLERHVYDAGLAWSGGGAAPGAEEGFSPPISPGSGTRRAAGR